MGCALPSVHHCCFVSPCAGPCSEPLTAELILWPVTRGMAPLPPAEHICSSLRSLNWEPLPISNHHLEVTQWQHLYFICFSAVPQKVGDSSIDFTCPFRKGALIYWLWCKFTRLIYRRETSSRKSNTWKLLFFCHLVTLDVYSYMQICSWLSAVAKKDKV